MKPRVGTQVTQHVRLVRPLGAGGMGSVWVAEHTTLSTEVAVKFIATEHAAKDRFVARFSREASTAARLKSPHVVQIFDHGVTYDGIPYIVMELLEGESLGERLERGEMTSLRETGLLVAQVSKVLEAAHAAGIVHRDLKPDNLFLTDAGYELFVKVLDFGVAKAHVDAVDDLTDSGAMVGTPRYMSPEALRHAKEVDHRADLWSLGVLTYHALTGKPPFMGETIVSLGMAISEGVFKPASALREGLPPEIDGWFERALAVSVDDRFQSARELADAFRAACADSVDSPPTSDSLPPSVRQSRPRVIAAGASQIDSDAATIMDPSDAAGAAGKSDDSDETFAKPMARIATDDDDAPDSAPELEPDSSPREAGATEGSTLAGATSPSGGRSSGRRWWLAVVPLGLGAALALVLLRSTTDPGEQAASAPEVTSGDAAPGDPSAVPSAEDRIADAASAAPSGVPEATASATTSPPPAAPIAAPPAAPPAGPRPAAGPKAGDAAKPPASQPDCTNKFITNENGDLVPRPECF